MSEEEIKKMAREYAHLRAFDGGFFPKEDEIAEDFEVCLKLLAEDYCIVPKNKVIEYYDLQESISHMGNHVSGKTLAQGAVMGLLKIFGKELFDQKEE